MDSRRQARQLANQFVGTHYRSQPQSAFPDGTAPLRDADAVPFATALDSPELQSFHVAPVLLHPPFVLARYGCLKLRPDFRFPGLIPQYAEPGAAPLGRP